MWKNYFPKKSDAQSNIWKQVDTSALHSITNITNCSMSFWTDGVTRKTNIKKARAPEEIWNH